MEKKTFEEFKDEVAKDHAYPNWDAIPYKNQLIWIEMVCKKFTLQEKKAYALSCIEASLLKAAENATLNPLIVDSETFVINIDSITDPKNHVLL